MNDSPPNKEKVKITIIGSRTFDDKERLFQILDKNFEKIEMIISGGAQGADLLGQLYAQERGLPCLIHYPRWHSIDGTYDKGAGLRRTRSVINGVDMVLVFWDGKSNGTKRSIDLAERLGKKVKIFKFNPPIKSEKV